MMSTGGMNIFGLWQERILQNEVTLKFVYIKYQPILVKSYQRFTKIMWHVYVSRSVSPYFGVSITKIIGLIVLSIVVGIVCGRVREKRKAAGWVLCLLERRDHYDGWFYDVVSVCPIAKVIQAKRGASLLWSLQHGKSEFSSSTHPPGGYSYSYVDPSDRKDTRSG